MFSLAGRRRPGKKAIACGEGLFLRALLPDRRLSVIARAQARRAGLCLCDKTKQCDFC
jgi:hypothetical protein